VPSPILDAANAVMRLAPEGFTKSLFSARRSPQKPILATVPDEDNQAEYVVRQVLENREAGLALCAQAVLFRTGHHSGRPPAASAELWPALIDFPARFAPPAAVLRLEQNYRSTICDFDVPLSSSLCMAANGATALKKARMGKTTTRAVRVQADLTNDVEPGYHTSALVRALSILDIFSSERRPLAVKDLHLLLDLPKPTVSRQTACLGLLQPPDIIHVVVVPSASPVHYAQRRSASRAGRPTSPKGRFPPLPRSFTGQRHGSTTSSPVLPTTYPRPTPRSMRRACSRSTPPK
jgi:hypothetical protein